MKFTGIVASLAVAGIASAAAIPRNVAVSTNLDSTLSQLSTVVSSLQGTVGGLVGNVEGAVNLGGLSSRKRC